MMARVAGCQPATATPAQLTAIAIATRAASMPGRPARTREVIRRGARLATAALAAAASATRASPVAGTVSAGSAVRFAYASLRP
jgi:hypothetical protein